MHFYTAPVLKREDFLHLDKIIASEALKPVTEKEPWRQKLKPYANKEEIGGIMIRYGGHGFDANGYTSKECHAKYSDAYLRLELRGWTKNGTVLPLAILPIVLDGASFGGNREVLTTIGYSFDEEQMIENVLTIGEVFSYGHKDVSQFHVHYHGKDVLDELRLTTFKLHTLTCDGHVFVFNEPLMLLNERMKDLATYPILHVLGVSEVQAAQHKFKALCTTSK